MRTVLPGAAIGLFGGGENSRMFALAARQMGYRVHVYSSEDIAHSLAEVSIQAPYEDLDRVREFASRVDVVTVANADVPVIALRAAARFATMRPSAAVFETVENGIGTKREAEAVALLDFSLIGARGADGDCVFYDAIAIDRVAGVIDIARAPAPMNSRVVKQAIQIMRDVLEDLDLTGVACIEFSLMPNNRLVIHEVTPHPHVSGHLTVDACVTGQFEQQLRAVCGLPLGSTETLRPAAMAVVAAGETSPNWAAAWAFRGVKLHVSGAGGYLTALASSATRAKQIAGAARLALTTADEHAQVRPPNAAE